MTPENPKPEWFQMTEGDGFDPKPASKRALKMLALATPLLVLGAGLVFAQSQDSPTALASASVSTAPAASTPISVSTPATTSPNAAVQVSQATPTPSTPAAGITKPGIKLPTGGDDARISDDD